LKFVDGVTSLVTTDFPDGSADGMIVEPLVGEDFTGTPEELIELKANLQDWSEMFESSLYSKDFKATQILVTIDREVTHDEVSVLYSDVMNIVSEYDFLDIRVAGDPVLTEKAEVFMHSDLASLIPMVILVLLLCLYFSFHRLSGTLLPMITVVITTIWTVALMAIFGISFTVVSTCLPVLLIAIGSAYGIHVMNHYYTDMRNTKEVPDKAKHKEMVADSVKMVLKPVMLAGFTTIVGFSSIITSPINPLKTFGLFSSIGVLIALILSITFIPALIILSYKGVGNTKAGGLDERKKRRQEKSLERMNAVYNRISRHTVGILVATVLIVIASAYGLSQMNIESALIEYFPKESSIRVDSDYISDTFAGTNTFNVVLRGDNAGDVIDPQVLKEMDNLKEYLLAENPEIGKIMSYSDFIKRMNQIMNFPAEDVVDEYDSYGDDSFGDSGDDSFGSFFGGDMADDTESDDSFGSFFGDDEEEDTDMVMAESVSFEPSSLSEQVTWQKLIEITRDVINEKGAEGLTVETLTKEIEREFNYRGRAYYEIPSDPAKYPASSKEELKNLISQYLLLYSGSLDKFSDDILEPVEVRMLIQIKNYDTAVVSEIIDDIDRYAENHFPENITVEKTGLAEMTKALTDMITGSQIKSLLSALIAVFLIVAIAYKSPVAGIFGIIPLFLSILINFGIMGLTGIKLDMVTSLIASIAIGVGVDYTIHFLGRYKIERQKTDDLNEVTRNTVLSTGKAIITNAVSVGLGFAVLLFSQFIVLRYIGVLVAVIMLTSSVAALTVLPALLNLFKPKFISRD